MASLCSSVLSSKCCRILLFFPALPQHDLLVVYALARPQPPPQTGKQKPPRCIGRLLFSKYLLPPVLLLLHALPNCIQEVSALRSSTQGIHACVHIPSNFSRHEAYPFVGRAVRWSAKRIRMTIKDASVQG
eukprot:6417519-Pyramimonas_sp.AAC.2